MKKRRLTPEHKAAIAKAHRGKKVPPAGKIKLSLAQRARRAREQRP